VSTIPRNTAEIRLSFPLEEMRLLQQLPWHKPLQRWTRRDARFMAVKSGLARHVVRFVLVKNNPYAIKETSPEAALKEYQSYLELQHRGIPTLRPVGTVVRDEGFQLVETKSGNQIESVGTGYLVTSLLEYALPDYHLFRRAFRKENRRRIWDVIIRLFVHMHRNGVYWGDASLSNMMIVFAKQHFPEIGLRTVLRAVLADAETVEIAPSVSEKLRLSDIQHFLESMAWTEGDMQASGVLQGPLMRKEDEEYILNRYVDLFETEKEEQTFELITKMDVDRLIGPFEHSGQSKILLQHIYEHKWYLSEREGRDVPIEEAARDWYANIFKPVLKLFTRFRLVDEFPDRTAASLYLDIMLHKYYLSEQVGQDVGLLKAFESYSAGLRGNQSAMKKVNGVASSIEKILRG